MSKFKNKDLDIMLDDDMLDIEMENISIEELDKEMEEFYIDTEKIDAIKAPADMKLWVREAATKAQADMKKQQRIRRITGIAASICVILTIGAYNPALAHKLPPLEKILSNINNALNIDEIASFLGIDKLIPKAEVDENDNIKFIKMPDYKVKKENNSSLDIDKIESETKVEAETKVESSNQSVLIPRNEYDAIQFVHRMSNSIIKAKDNRKYGQIEITPENIDIAISSLDLVGDSSTRSYIKDQLNKWKDGDFDNAVTIHNFVWDILEGEVGKAIAVDRNAVREIKAKHFE
ncbi:MAG: DUF6241 domain-containing protein [Peptostreptococcaceae bacterium]